MSPAESSQVQLWSRSSPSCAASSLSLCIFLGEKKSLKTFSSEEIRSIKMKSTVQGSSSSSLSSSKHKRTCLPSIFICTCSPPYTVETEVLLEAIKSATSCTKRRHFYTILGCFLLRSLYSTTLSDSLCDQCRMLTR